jgi:spermidine dehydrogenase
MRLSSTVVDVVHDGEPGSSKGVIVTYLRGGQLYKARARATVMAGQQHANKHICRDLPARHRNAMENFAHGPVLTVNVALKNWKFMDKLGISAARWFEGFGWFTSINRTVLIDGKEPMALDPGKPIVLTLYMGFGIPGLPYKQQAMAARARLFNMSFLDIETAVRNQFNTMFASVGFDAKRDIAGIIANRWGHAYAVEQPGFYFGTNGEPAPSNIIRQRHDRIAFCHAELQGTQTWPGAAIEGSRAARQALDVI